MKNKNANIKLLPIGWFLPAHLLPTHKKPANCSNFFSLAAIKIEANENFNNHNDTFFIFV